MKNSKTSFMFTNKNVRELAKKDNGTITDIYYDSLVAKCIGNRECLYI